jgi:protein-S-isoprenylcysteine O-methyltransferase Ste14
MLGIMRNRLIAIILGIINHSIFVCAISLMAMQLFCGMTSKPIWSSPFPILTNAFLILQFPIIHSWLLGKKGREFLTKLFPADLGKLLLTTSYTTVASIQLVLTFGFWSPSNFVLWNAETFMIPMSIMYGLSWLLLGWSMYSADLRIQTGALGWMALARGQKPNYPQEFPTSGLFSICRQPIYLSFAMILWTGPYLTLDKIILAFFWTAYCFWGPKLKEKRFSDRWGKRFAEYQGLVPYFIPSLRRLKLPGAAETFQP